MVGTTLEIKGSPENFEVLLSELVIVSCVGDSCHRAVQQGHNLLGFFHADLQTERRSLRIVYPLTEPLVACPHKSEPSLKHNDVVSVFTDNGGEVYILQCPLLVLPCCFNDKRRSPGCQVP